MADIKTIRISGTVYNIHDEVARENIITVENNLRTYIDSQLQNLTFVPIEITSFTNNKSIVEKGSTVDNVTLAWSLSRTPKNIRVNDILCGVNDTSKIYNDLSLTTDTVYTLSVTDSDDTVKTKTTSVTFRNGVYYGVSASNNYDSELILSLQHKVLRGNKLPQFSVTAGTNDYIYYVLPTSYGTCNFTVGGFSGGFEKVITLNFTNSFNFTESYDIYKSVNTNLGDTTITVS